MRSGGWAHATVEAEFCNVRPRVVGARVSCSKGLRIHEIYIPHFANIRHFVTNESHKKAHKIKKQDIYGIYDNFVVQYATIGEYQHYSTSYTPILILAASS